MLSQSGDADDAAKFDELRLQNTRNTSNTIFLKTPHPRPKAETEQAKLIADEDRSTSSRYVSSEAERHWP